jgi:hypothetical protein
VTVLSRSAVLAVAAAFLLALWTGCAATPPAADALTHAMAPTQSQRPDPNAPYVVPAPRRPAAPPAAVALTQASPCSPDALKVQEIAGNVHGSYHSIKLGFRNQTRVACELSGYPTVALFDGQKQPLGSIAVQRTSLAEVRSELGESSPGQVTSSQSAPAATREGGSQKVVLMPNSVAAFQVVWSAGENCPSVARLLVTAPGAMRTFSVSQPMSVCMGRVQVTPLALDQGDD